MDIPLPYYIALAAVFLILVGTAVRLGRGRRSQPLENPYVEALKFLVADNMDAAYAMLQESVKQGVAPTDAYIKLGALLRDRGEVSKALQIHQSLTVKTNLTRDEKVELFVNLAEDYARVGNLEKSVKVLDSAVRHLRIREERVFSMLAKHYHLLGQTEKAYEALKELKKLGAIGDRELGLYLVSAAESKRDKDDLKEARRFLQRAAKHDSDCAPCQLLMGDVAEQSLQPDEAIRYWKRAAMLAEELSGPALQKLERSLFDKGLFGDMERIYHDVRAARVGDEAATLALTAFYKKQGRTEEAIHLLEEFVGAYPDSVRASLRLTSFYARHRDAQTLERFLDESIKESWQPRHFHCGACDFRSHHMRWHCPRCNGFDTFNTLHTF